MKRIDFLGPSAVGKTTLLNYCLSSRKDRFWITEGEANKNVLKNILLFNNNIFCKVFFSVALSIPFLYKTINRRILNNRFRRNVFWLQRNKWEKVVYETLKIIIKVGRKEPIRALYKIKHFLAVTEKISIYESHLNDECVLFDESILGKLLSIFLENEYFNDEIYYKVIIDNIPAPNGIIIMIDKIDNIYNRLINRNLNIISYKGKSKDEIMNLISESIRICKNFADLFKSRGIAVLLIDSSDGIEENSKKLDMFIAEVSSKKNKDIQKNIL